MFDFLKKKKIKEEEKTNFQKYKEECKKKILSTKKYNSSYIEEVVVEEVIFVERIVYVEEVFEVVVEKNIINHFF